MNRHVYFGIANLALNDTQRAALVAVLNDLGPLNNPQPCENNHRRVRLDGDAAIYEALWNEDTITVQTFKDRLGDIFSIDPATITHAVNLVTFSARETAVVTFSRNGTDYLRVVFFGYAGNGNWPTWDESRVEVLRYLANNAAAWGDA
jgi:hypothetical protein